MLCFYGMLDSHEYFFVLCLNVVYKKKLKYLLDTFCRFKTRIWPKISPRSGQQAVVKALKEDIPSSFCSHRLMVGFS